MMPFKRKLNELRKHFLDIPRSHLRIALMLEDKRMSKTELIEICAKMGKSRDTVERQIRYMIAEKIIAESEGFLFLQNPRRYYYIVLHGKDTILARWFIVMIPTSIIAYLFTYLNIQITQFLTVLIFLMTIGFFIDLRAHRIF